MFLLGPSEVSLSLSKEKKRLDGHIVVYEKLICT